MNKELSNQLNMSAAFSEGRNWRKTTNQAQENEIQKNIKKL